MTEYFDMTNLMARYRYEFVQTAGVIREGWQVPFETKMALTFPDALKLIDSTSLLESDVTPVEEDTLLGYEYKIGTTVVLSTVDKPFVMARQFNRLSYSIFTSENQPETMQLWGMGE